MCYPSQAGHINFLLLFPLSTSEEEILIQKLAFSSSKIKMSLDAWEADRQFHMSFLENQNGGSLHQAHNAQMEEIKTTPLFSADVLAGIINSPPPAMNSDILPQYSLLAGRLRTFRDSEPEPHNDKFGVDESSREPKDTRIFININTPWSAFICGSQGSGKSHTLSCMLESALIPSSLGKLPRPLAGIVFHYDKFSGFASSQICEAAYLCSAGIPVRVMVSQSNIHRMRKIYEHLPGIEEKAQPKVVALMLKETQLNVERMMKLMAVSDKEGPVPLYMEVSNRQREHLSGHSKKRYPGNQCHR